MATQLKSFHHSHSETVFKNDTSPQTRKMRNMATESGHEFLKVFIGERITGKGSVIESKPFTGSKKTCVFAQNLQNHGGKELLMLVRKGTEKLNIKENESKSGTHAKKMCFCSPTTHEGSFRCHLHRISAAKKPVTEKKSYPRLNSKRTHGKGMVEFKPQLSRFGRVASAEVGAPDSLIQLSAVESA